LMCAIWRSLARILASPGRSPGIKSPIEGFKEGRVDETRPFALFA
jgi:hypothetical protein